jgi:hypothetical protein
MAGKRKAMNEICFVSADCAGASIRKYVNNQGNSTCIRAVVYNANHPSLLSQINSF